MGNPAHSDVAVAEKLALTLAGSLLLHFALIFGLQIQAPYAAANASAKVIQARLLKEPEPVAVPQTTPMHITEPEPKPETPHKTEPAPKPASTTPIPSASADTQKKNVDLPSIEVPLIEDTTYYPAQDVDVHPSALQEIHPIYPNEAAIASVTGSVVLVLLLDEGGMVREASVEQANPPGMFEESALNAFRNARFTPAQRHGRSVKSRVRIKVNYELSGMEKPIDKPKQK